MIENGRQTALGYLAPWVTCALIVFVTYSMAKLTWRVAGQSPTLTAEPASSGQAGAGAPAGVSAGAATGTDSAGAADAATIAEWHLFGEVSSAPVLPKPVVIAPETRLDLRLAGIFHSTDGDFAPLALIAAGGERERNFRVGDEISDGVTLDQIHTDRVILARAGQLEALPLPRDPARSRPAPGRSNMITTKRARSVAAAQPPGSNANTLAKPQPPQPVGAAAQDQRTMVQAAKVARQLKSGKNLEDGLRNLAYADPYVKKGRFVGLKLRPGRDQGMLTKLGLRGGDVLTEVNGVALTDQVQSLTLLQKALSGDQVQAKVLRNGAVVPFTFVLTP